jgi:hypothetical protein
VPGVGLLAHHRSPRLRIPRSWCPTSRTACAASQPRATTSDRRRCAGDLPPSPTAASLGSSWKPDLVRRAGEALGRECREQRVAALLGPGANIKRSPLCGRRFEYSSEDPLISEALGAAMIAGGQSQGDRTWHDGRILIRWHAQTRFPWSPTSIPSRVKASLFRRPCRWVRTAADRQVATASPAERHLTPRGQRVPSRCSMASRCKRANP